MTALTPTATGDYSVSLIYPLPLKVELDECLEALAQVCGGRWEASGAYLQLGHGWRDVEFAFPTASAAAALARLCRHLAEVRILALRSNAA